MKNKGFFCLRNLIISLILFIVMYILINGSPFGLAKLMEITGGHSILDMEMIKGYSVDKAYDILTALGEEGRAFEMKYIIPLDFPFPLAYGFFFFITLTVIAKKIFTGMKKPWLIGLIALFGALCDWLENIMVIILLQNYPNQLDGIVKSASFFTQLKSLLISGSMLFTIIGLIAVIVKRFLPVNATRPS
ncbi:MAG: hypothetical protein GX660_16090 [Clostridiaceae bacterium]|nr:hypothetical protein [Clostridiaceae bacterium]